MKKIVCLLFLLLTACAGTAPTSTGTPTAIITPTPSPEPTPSLTPTPDLQAGALKALQGMGINAAHDASLEVGQFELLFNGELLPNAILDGQSLRIDMGDKKAPVLVPLSQIDERVKVVDGAITVDNAIGQTLVVFDPTLSGGSEFLGEYFELAAWKDRWVERAEVVSANPEAPVEINTWEDYFAIVHYEKLFINPRFPDNVYFPPSDKVVLDYQKSPTEGEFNSRNPLGALADLNRSMFRPGVNNIVFLPNEAEGRKAFECVSTEAVANMNGSVSFLHSSRSRDNWRECLKDLKELGNKDKRIFFLPTHTQDGDDLKISPLSRGNVAFFNKFGLSAPNGDLILVKPLVLQWFNDWKVPQKLEFILFGGYPKKWGEK